MIPHGECQQGCLNVDGRCILGGDLAPAGLRGNKVPSTGYPSPGCYAYPVFLRTSVPYVPNAAVAGSNLQNLNELFGPTVTKLNEKAFLHAVG
jgi:hypothetical protein